MTPDREEALRLARNMLARPPASQFSKQGWVEAAKALDSEAVSLAADLETAERERDKWKGAAEFQPSSWSDLWGKERERADKAERDLATAREALERIILELGVPDANYPAPVSNAVVIARDALRDRSLGEKA